MTLSTLGLACGVAWRRGLFTRHVTLAQLSPEERQSLVEAALTAAPTVFQPAWFEPRLGYTLRPGGRIAAWNDTFTANSLGYRSRPPEKPHGVFRVVFLGDSWTYGMGVRWQQSFPMQFERISNRERPPAAPRVEAWSLALPGYNTLNETAALEFFFDRLRPDAVVLCPTPNDIDSSNAVTPAGLLARSRAERDDFGDPHSYRFLLPLLDSPSFSRRWHLAFGEAARTEQALQQHGVPFFVFFTATWNDALAHSLMQESGLRASYAITPAGMTVGSWRNPPPFRHGTPEANRRYGRFVYELLAESLGWPTLGEGGRPAEEAARVFRSPPAASVGQMRQAAARLATQELPASFEPGRKAAPQCLAAMDCETGIAPKAATFLIRRRAGASLVAITLGRLPEPTWLYPLAVQVSVTDERETVRSTIVLDGRGAPEARFLVPSPHGSSAAIEVSFVAARATAAARGALAGRSLVVRRIEQR